jgi:hypothetical protein
MYCLAKTRTDANLSGVRSPGDRLFGAHRQNSKGGDMSSKLIRAVPFFVVAICLAVAYSIANAQPHAMTDKTSSPIGQSGASVRHNAPSGPTGVIYSQPHNLSGVLYPSSWQEPNGNDADQYVWDNFTLQASSGITITEIQWRGGYQSNSGTVLTFTVAIYPSIAGGSQPDVSHPPLVQYQASGNAGETPTGTFGGTAMYDYDFTLPAPFTASAGTTYWVQIEAWQSSIPNWGMAAGSGGNGQHFRRMTNGSDIFYQVVPGDTAFTLLGPVAEGPISGLHAQNDGPTLLGNITTLSAAVSSGSVLTYTWSLGDGQSAQGPVVTHTYSSIGFYTAIVTASNSVSLITATTPVTIFNPKYHTCLPLIFKAY